MDCAQIFVDGAEVMIRHVLMNWPWHDLQEIAYEWRFPGLSESSCVMVAEQLGAHDPNPRQSHDLHKLSERAASFRQPGFIWRQVARNDVRKIWPSYLKMPAAPRYVAGLIFVGWPK